MRKVEKHISFSDAASVVHKTTSEVEHFIRSYDSRYKLISSGGITLFGFLLLKEKFGKLDNSESDHKSAVQKISYSLEHHRTRLNLSSLNLERIPDEIYVLKGTLKTLDLSNNNLLHIEEIKGFEELTSLDLSRNYIVSIASLIRLEKLQLLNISDNYIFNLQPILKMNNLKNLDVSSNRIGAQTLLFNKKTKDFFDSQAKSFRLKIHDNLFVKEIEGLSSRDYPDLPSANHISTLTNDLNLVQSSKQNLIEHIPPQKIILVGNSNCGKTSLVDFLVNNNLQGDKTNPPVSTEMLDIVEWENPDISSRKIFIYDFGGQDFYHATYQMFFSEEANYILLWSKDNNENMLSSGDEKSRINSYGCFNINYWIGNIEYLNGINSNESRTTGTNDSWRKRLLLVENKIDLELKSEVSVNDAFGDIETFKVSLSGKSPLFEARRFWLRDFLLKMRSNTVKDFKSRVLAIEDYINCWDDLRREKNEWKFKELVDKLTSDFASWKILEKSEKETIIYRLSTYGMLLWYRFDNNLKGKVWIDPINVQREVIDILNLEEFEKNEGIVYESEMDKNQSFRKWKNLLLKQQVIFLNKSVKKADDYEVVVPQKLTPDLSSHVLFEMISTGLSFVFSLKFKSFMPLGIMNRIVTIVGDLPEQKLFSRSQLIFTFNGANVLLESCQKSLSLTFKTSTRSSKLSESLFLIVLSAYLQKSLVTETTEDNQIIIDPKFRSSLFDSIPNDLMISLETPFYIEYNMLIDGLTSNVQSIPTKNNTNEIKLVRSHHFNPFTKNNFNMPKSLFISYSHDDLAFRNDLQQHLKNLERDGEIEIWQDGLIKPGEIWDDVIKANLSKADIVVMLISQSFISSSYINEVELRTALTNHLNKQSLIIPVLVKNCDYKNWKAIPQEISEGLLENIFSISNFQFLPQSKENMRLTAINKWEYPEDAWVQITNAIRGIINTE